MIKTPDKIRMARAVLTRSIRYAEEALEELKRMEAEKRNASIDLTNEQAARLIGCSARTIIRMREDGRLKSNNFLDVLEYKRRTA